VAHPEFEHAGLAVAGISLSAPDESRHWTERLALPFPLLSDTDRRAADAFQVMRRVGIGSWSLEFLSRATFLADGTGVVRAVWEKVKIRGHAREVLDVARGLGRL